MITFKTPGQASAYETKYMMRPLTWPPTTHAVPTLWERTRSFFAEMLAITGSAMRVACRRFVSRAERRKLVLRLEPVEKLVRTLMIIEAITLLLMTPWGLKVRQTTKPCAIPPPPLQVGARKSPEPWRGPAAMMGLAVLQPRIDPRIAEREASEKEQRRLAALAAKRQLFEDFDPRALNASFRVTHWVHEASTRVAPARLPRALVLDDYTLATMPVRSDPPRRDADDDLDGPMAALGRRIAALERVLADPWPAIRRLARRIAAIPRDCFPAPWPRRLRATRWLHGCREFYNACILAKSAFRALNRAYGLPPDDPG